SESGFKIERATNGVNFTQIASVSADVTAYTNTVAPATTYQYRVRAYNVVADSPFSNIAAAETPAGAPAAPSALTATAANSRVLLGWPASPGATSYKVKRSLVNGGPVYLLIGSSATTTYTDATATNGTTYYYVVTAANGTGESAASPQAAATPSSAVT